MPAPLIGRVFNLLDLAYYMKGIRGFTLIELMVVVAIVALLAAIAVPVYSKYLAKVKVVAALDEITLLMRSLQVSLDEGADVASPAAIEGVTRTGNCSTISAIGNSTTGIAQVSCTIANAPTSVQGKTIEWNRSPEDGWTCSTTIPAEFNPPSCSTAL